MRFFLRREVILFFAMFAVGFILFFPVHRLQNPLVEFLQKKFAVNLNLSDLRVTTGVTLGLGRGGLFAVRASDVSIGNEGGTFIQCRDLILSPSFLPLFVGQMRMGVWCELEKDSSVTATATISPVWSISTATLGVAANLNKINIDVLQAFFPPGALTNVGAVVDGSIDVSELSLERMDLSSPAALFDLKAFEIKTPSVEGFVRLPALTFASLEAKGSLKSNRLNVEKLKIGSSEDLLECDLKADLELDESRAPVGGEITGKIRADAGFEAQVLKDLIPMDTYFGKIKPSGFREFKKPIQGSFLSLLAPPVEE